MKKRIFYTEAAYLLGIALLALGTALMERGGFGISIVVAPAYVLHLATSLSFGVAEYILQGAILLLTVVLLRRARLRFFLSFVTALLYGAVLDGCMALVMPVISTTLSGTGRPGLISWLNSATSTPFSMRTAPISIISSVWVFRPVVSTSSTT